MFSPQPHTLTVRWEFSPPEQAEREHTSTDAKRIAKNFFNVKQGGTDYDVVVPSDYMIGQMVEEGLLAELNFVFKPPK